MSPDQWAGLLLVALALVGAVVWLRDTILRRRKRAELERMAQLELELAGPCEVCTRYLGTVLVVDRTAYPQLRLMLVCNGCADRGVIRGWHTIVSRTARRVA